MIDLRSCARPVHRSLLEREMLAGVPQAGLFILFLLAVVFVYGMRLYFMIAFIVVLYFVMRALTKKDPWLIDIVLENINQKDVFIP
jgi:type IV secretory pathway TrbD component